MTTLGQAFIAIESSDHSEAAKREAIGILFDASVQRRGIVFASPEQRQEVYDKLRSALRQEFVKGTSK